MTPEDDRSIAADATTNDDHDTNVISTSMDIDEQGSPQPPSSPPTASNATEHHDKNEHDNDTDSDSDDNNDDENDTSDSDSDGDDGQVIVHRANHNNNHMGQQGYYYGDDDDDHDDDDDDDDDDDMYHDEPDAFTSIWDMVGTYAQSPLEQMLSKDKVDQVTLENVLDEDTLLQEIKAANAKVVEFVAQPKHITKLLHYLTTEHYREDMTEEELKRQDEDIEDLEESEQTLRIFKYPFVASEVICCDVDSISDAIVSSEENVLALFSYLSNRQQGKTALNPSLSLYFTKALSTLLQKNYMKIVDILMRAHNDDSHFLENVMVKNIGLCDMDILILKLLGFETPDEGFDQDAFGGFATQQRIRELFLMKQRFNDKELQDKKKLMQQWAVDQGLVETMMERMEQDVDDEDMHHNIFNLFCDLIEKGNNPLSTKLYSTETLECLVDMIVKHSHTSIFMNGVPFLRVLADHGGSFITEEDTSDKVPPFMLAIHSKTKEFVDLLTLEDTDADATPQIELTSGTLVPPLGETRLRTVEHLQLLFRTTFTEPILKDLIEWNALPRVIDLFFHYEFNNMLHLVVFGIIQNVIEGENARLKEVLFVDCQLAGRMLQAMAENERVIAESKGMRMGHIGYIVELANLIRNTGFDENASVAKFAEATEGWKEFLAGPLQAMNNLNETQLGGPVPIGSALLQQPPSAYQFDDDSEDSDDDNYNYDDTDSDSDDSDDDDVVVRRVPQAEEAEQEGSDSDSNSDSDSEDEKPDKSEVEEEGITAQSDFDADFDSNL